jgi:endonuclease/exonuclease/phosphatase family metal-dependent hydrolase
MWAWRAAWLSYTKGLLVRWRILTVISLTLGAAALCGCGKSSKTSDRTAMGLMASHDELNVNDPEVTGQSDSLSVMQYNMHRRDRPNELQVVAADLRDRVAEVPDFILLQEVMHERDEDKGTEINTAIVFAKELGYCCRSTQRNTDREGSAIISRYPFAYYEARQLKAQTSKWALGQNRISIMGEFQVPNVGLVRVVNVHFTNWGYADDVRGAQLQETLEWIAARQREHPASAIILGGDFNAVPSGSELDVIRDTAITGGLVFHDYNDHSTPTFGKEDGVRRRLDYIFIATPSRTALTCTGEECLWPNALVIPTTGHRFVPSYHKAVVHRYRIGPATASTGDASDRTTTPINPTGGSKASG